MSFIPRRLPCFSNRNLLHPDAALGRACRGPSDALARRSDHLDPIRERLHEPLQEFASAVAGELAMFIEELVDMANIGFGCCMVGTFRNTSDCLR